jgi:hypothetical protein
MGYKKSNYLWPAKDLEQNYFSVLESIIVALAYNID